MADELHGVKRKMLDFNRQCNKLKEAKATLMKQMTGVTGASTGRNGVSATVEDADIADAAISGVLSWRDPGISITSTRPSTAIIQTGRPKFVGGGFNLSQPPT